MIYIPSKSINIKKITAMFFDTTEFGLRAIPLKISLNNPIFVEFLKFKKMFDAIKKLLGFSTTDYAELVKNGALIVDVRSKSEFKNGHIKNALNIPVNELSGNLSKLKDKNKAIITCCASGMRSATAKNILQNAGYKEVYNGGSWASLQGKI